MILTVSKMMVLKLHSNIITKIDKVEWMVSNVYINIFYIIFIFSTMEIIATGLFC